MNSGEDSIELILSEALEISFQSEYLITPKGRVFLKSEEGVEEVKYRKAGYKNKYTQVYIKTSDNHTGANYFLHRLVATHFLEKGREDQTQVNHLDGDTNNNFVSNLEWCSPKENMAHAYEKGLSYQGAECPWAVNSEEFIRSICECLQQRMTPTQIRSKLGTVSPKLLFKIRRRKQWISVSKDYDF